MKNRMKSAGAARFGVGSVSVSTATTALFVSGISSTALAQWTTVNGYASTADSAISAVTGGQLLVNDLEGAGSSLALVISGSAGQQAGNSIAQDGAAGKSLQVGSFVPFLSATVTLAISEETLGAAPTRFGFAITSSSIEAGDPAVPTALPIMVTVYYTDGSSSTDNFDVLSLDSNATDDVFLGLSADKGIDLVTISSVMPFSIDHVQYDAPASTPWVQIDPYASASDGPFGANGDTIVVNDLEAGLDSQGLVIESGARVDGDSVAADGAPGKSLAVGSFSPPLAAATTMRLDPAETGGAPTQFGFVVTNATIENEFGNIVGLPITVIAFRPDGSTVTAVHTIRSLPGDSGDDVFVGITVPEGIDSVEIASVAPFNIDHIQYDAAPALVPDYVKDDLDQDGKSDVFWQLSGQSRASVWTMDGLVREATTGTLPNIATGSTASAVGDLDGDRIADMVWRKTSNGALTGWLMSPTGVGASGPLSQTLGKEWKLLGMNDLDGNRRADLVFLNTTTRLVRMWSMNGLTVESSADIGTLAAGLSCIGIGDLTADGKADLVFRSASGEVRAWIMNGATIITDSVLQNSAARKASIWYIAGVADVNGDRKADILWQHRTLGRVDVWLMDGARVTSMGNTERNVAAGWRVVGTPDLNGDGKRDLLLRKTSTNQINGYLMDGRATTAAGFIRRTTAAWKNLK